MTSFCHHLPLILQKKNNYTVHSNHCFTFHYFCETENLFFYYNIVILGQHCWAFVSKDGMIYIWSDLRGARDWHVPLISQHTLLVSVKMLHPGAHHTILFYVHQHTLALMHSLQYYFNCQEQVEPSFHHLVSGVLKCSRPCFLSTGTSWFPRSSGPTWFSCKFYSHSKRPSPPPLFQSETESEKYQYP